MLEVEFVSTFFSGTGMDTIVGLSTEVLHKFVYELRYDFGQVYWDRAGRIAKGILSELDEWDFDTIDINRCQLSHRDQSMAFNFGHAKLDLMQTQSIDVESLLPIGEFGALAETLTQRVTESLELEFFPRIGFRAWHLYPAGDRDQSFELVRQLQMVSVDAAILNPIGQVSDASYRLVVERPKHMLRIAVAPFEQKIELPQSVLRAAKVKAFKQETEKRRGPGISNRQQTLIDQMKAKRRIANYPHFGVLLDLDAYVEDPPYPDDLSVSDFISGAFEDYGKVKSTILTASH